MRPHRWQPTRLPRPWASPGKNTGMDCHFLLQCMKVKSESEVAQSCLTFCDPVDCSPLGSSIHGIFQARVLEWGAIAFSEIPLRSPIRLKVACCHQLGQNRKGKPTPPILVPVAYLPLEVYIILPSWVSLIVPDLALSPPLPSKFARPSLSQWNRTSICNAEQFYFFL